MAKSKIPAARRRIAALSGMSEAEVVSMANASKQAQRGRVRDWYRAMETYYSKEAGLPSIYAPKQKPKFKPTPTSTPTPDISGYRKAASESKFTDVDRLVEEAKRYNVWARESQNRAVDIAANKYGELVDRGVSSRKAESVARAIEAQAPREIPEDYVREHSGTESQRRQLSGYFNRMQEYGDKDYVIQDDKVINRAVQQEAKLVRESFNAEVKRERKRAAEREGYSSWKDIPEQERQIMQARQSSLQELPENLQGNRAIFTATENYYITDAEYMETYISAMKDSGVPEDIRKSVESSMRRLMKPEFEGAIREIMERRDPETQIAYYYSDKNSKTPFHEPLRQRYENMVRYWENRVEEFGA